MTNLTEIFQFLNDYGTQERDECFDRSKDFFCSTGKNRSIFFDQVQAIDKIWTWVQLLENPGSYTLSDGITNIDFLMLCNSLEDGRVRHIYMDIKSIRAEMLPITTGDTLEEFKKLNQFWESLELSLQVIMK